MCVDELRLYCLPSCPYCHKVLNFMDKNDLHIPVMSTLDPENQDFLLRNGGSNQVPCLFIDERAMYESDDIIAYLKEHKEALAR